MSFNWKGFDYHVSGIRNRLANERDSGDLPRVVDVDDLFPERRKKQRKARSDDEHESQCAVVQWAELMVLTGKYPDLDCLHAVPNGGFRDKRTAGRLKAEGLKPGVPDLELPVSRGGFSGLGIEMKAGDNEPSGEQKEWHKRLVRVGWCIAICWTAAQAIETLEDYLCGRIQREAKAEPASETPSPSGRN